MKGFWSYLFLFVVVMIMTAPSSATTWMVHDLLAPPPDCICDTAVKLDGVKVDGVRGDMIMEGCYITFSPWALPPEPDEKPLPWPEDN